MSFTSVKSYPVSVASADLPKAWLSSSAPRVAPANKKIVVISSQNGSQTAGGALSFVLPSNLGSGFMISGSAYLRMTITPNVLTGFAFKQYGSATSVINRATFLASGAIVEQILNYNKLYSTLLLHASSPDFAQGDDSISQYTLNGAALTAAVDVCVPVLLGSFNSTQNFPLFLLNSAQLNIDLESVASAFIGIAANPTDYTVSNASLTFEQLIPDHQFEQGMKAMLAQRLYQLPINTWYNVKTAAATAIAQNIGLNSSSVRSILWNVVPDESITRSGAFTSGGQTVARVFLDGQLLFNGNLDTTATPQVCFLEMNRSLNNMFDNNRTSVANNEASSTAPATAASVVYSNITRAKYLDRAYLGGLSAQKTSEDGFAMVGQAVSTAVLEWNGTAAGTIYIYVALQQVITIDGMGSASLVR